VVRVVVLVVA
jgi:hypothetical protein